MAVAIVLPRANRSCDLNLRHTSAGPPAICAPDFWTRTGQRASEIAFLSANLLSKRRPPEP